MIGAHLWEVACPDCGARGEGEATDHRDAWAQMDVWKANHITAAHPRRSKGTSEYRWAERVVFPGAAEYDDYARRRHGLE